MNPSHLWLPSFLTDKKGVTAILAPSHRKYADLFWIGLLIVCAIFSRCVFVIRPFDSDSAMFIYMGRLISEGGRFQHEIVDNKFPTVGLLMSAPWRILDSNWFAWVMLGAMLSAIACWRLAKAARDTFGAGAMQPTLLAAIVLLNFNFTVFGGFQLETIHVFFASLAAAAALDALRKDDLRDSFLVGLAAAMGAYAKPTALAVALAFSLAFSLAMIIHMRTHRARLIQHGIATAAGAGIPLLAFLIYLVGADNLKDMPALYQQISLYAANSSWSAEDINKPITVLILVGFPFLVRGWIFRRQRIEGGRENPTAMLFLFAWLAMELMGVVMQRRMYAYHFMPIAAPIALLFGAIPRRNETRFIVPALVPLAIFSVVGAANVLRYGYDANGNLLASDYLRQHAIQGERVWQDDVPRLLLETGLHSGSRHPLTFLFANDDEAPLRYGSTLVKDFAIQRPRYIVLPTDLTAYVAHQEKYILELERVAARRANYSTAWGWIEAYVKQHYTPESRVGGQTVWVRRDFDSLAKPPVASGACFD